MEADMPTDDEFHAGQADSGVWHHSAAESQIGIAQVHNDRGLRQHHNRNITLAKSIVQSMIKLMRSSAKSKKKRW